MRIGEPKRLIVADPLELPEGLPRREEEPIEQPEPVEQPEQVPVRDFMNGSSFTGKLKIDYIDPDFVSWLFGDK